MSGYVLNRLAREPSTSPCARCRQLVALAAGEWYAADTANLERPVCDPCAQRDDPDGFEQVRAWRRTARPTWRTAA